MGSLMDWRRAVMRQAAPPTKGLHKMTAAEHFKIVNDVWTKHKGGPMTSLELAQGLNGAFHRGAGAVVRGVADDSDRRDALRGA